MGTVRSPRLEVESGKVFGPPLFARESFPIGQIVSEVSYVPGSSERSAALQRKSRTFSIWILIIKVKLKWFCDHSAETWQVSFTGVVIMPKKGCREVFFRLWQVCGARCVFGWFSLVLFLAPEPKTMSQPERKEDAEQPKLKSELEQNGVLVNPRAVCHMCKRLYRDPKILPCLHTFCSDCIGQLEPFSVSSRRSVRSGEAAEADRPAVTVTVLCPGCDYEVDIPASGPAGLSTDHLALDEVFLETLVTDGPLGCDLCGEGGAESRCEVCTVNLCEFCCQAHR